ncbi:DUF4124 domain-containing protein [Undibacterium sp. Ji49W]|uniref:DUF4124 domain-containing protein n=1 Tax=Undibacterium sp. Ji49W TaxID=3413040 RepID=UPI003BF40B8F
MKKVHLVSAAMLLAMSNMASAQIQRCVDSDGRVTFTDNVCAKSSVKQKSVHAGQKMVGSGSGSGSDVGGDGSMAAKNDAFNQRQAVRDHNNLVDNMNYRNQNTAKEIMNSPLPDGVRSRTLTTYSADKPPKVEYK